MITVGWQPFAARGMTVGQTAGWLVWAIAQFNAVARCGMVARGGRVDISVRGGAFDWAAMYADPRRGQVWVSTIRDMRGAAGRVFGSFLMHEFGHLKPFNFGHTPNETRFRTFLMHPWGSSHHWWHPREVQTMQNRHGGPTRQPWQPMPIRDQASVVAAVRRETPVSVAKDQAATREYWGRVNVWRSIPLAGMTTGTPPARWQSAVPETQSAIPATGMFCGFGVTILPDFDDGIDTFDDPRDYRGAA